ncbi:MAG: V-type ATP synthase subunit E family protein [Candidatus Diapherotrites archaeon]
MQGIMEKIRGDSERRARAIGCECESEALRIRAEALAKARGIIAKAREQAERDAETAEKRAVARANLNAKKEEAALLDMKLGEILAEAQKSLPELRKEKAFAAKLRAMALEAMKEIPSGGIVVEASGEDSKIIAQIVKGKNARLEIVKGLGPGAIVRSADGSMKIDCTFRALLEEKKSGLKKELAEAIGG